MRKPSVLVIFLTVFIDLIGFGIVLPLLPVLSKDLGASGFQIGVIQASFSAMQFLFAPAWGRLSDRIGRRPVLLASTAAATLSYVVFALGCGLTGTTALWVILGSRLLAGICGANITVAQAYIADITPPSERSKKMGLIGMAFGLGFVCGPLIAAAGVNWFDNRGPGILAAALCALNFILAFFILPESWKPNSEQVASRPRVNQWLQTLSNPRIRLLIAVFFLATFCFASFETTLGLLVAKNFHLDLASKSAKTTTAYLIAYCGIIGAVVQGGAIGRMVKKSGEARLIANSMFLLAISLAPLPFIHSGHGNLSWALLLIVLAVLAIGSSLTRPPVFGLISVLTPPTEQGGTIGVAQSAGSLARIFAPIFAASLLELHPALPYLICSVISFFTGILVVRFLPRDRPNLAPGQAADAASQS